MLNFLVIQLPQNIHVFIHIFLNCSLDNGLIILDEGIGLRVIFSENKDELKNIIVFLSKGGFIRIQERPDEGQNEYLIYLLDRAGGKEKRKPGSKKPVMRHVFWAVLEAIQFEEKLRRREILPLRIEKMQTSLILSHWFRTLNKKSKINASHTSLLCWIDMLSYWNVTFFPKKAILLDNESIESTVEYLIRLGFVKQSDKSITDKKYTSCLPTQYS